MRASLRLWKPVRYSSRAAKSKSIFSGTVTVVFRFFEAGGAMVGGSWEREIMCVGLTNCVANCVCERDCGVWENYLADRGRVEPRRFWPRAQVYGYTNAPRE